MRQKWVLVGLGCVLTVAVAALAVGRTPLPTSTAPDIPANLDERLLSACSRTLLAQEMPVGEAFQYWAPPHASVRLSVVSTVWVVAADCSDFTRRYGNGGARVVIEIFASGTGRYLVTNSQRPWAYRLAFWRWQLGSR